MCLLDLKHQGNKSLALQDKITHGCLQGRQRLQNKKKVIGAREALRCLILCLFGVLPDLFSQSVHQCFGVFLVGCHGNKQLKVEFLFRQTLSSLRFDQSVFVYTQRSMVVGEKGTADFDYREGCNVGYFLWLIVQCYN